MHTHADKKSGNRNRAVANSLLKQQMDDGSALAFEDNRPIAIQMKALQEIANNSTQVKQLRSYQEMANNNPKVRQAAQLQSIANTRSKPPVQRQDIEEDELKVDSVYRKENKAGLPDDLKSGIENLSGSSMEDVKVHYNSDKPAQFRAHAYAHGTDIHMTSGQERHLPHEAWHAVQQKQGRVNPTMQMKFKVGENQSIKAIQRTKDSSVMPAADIGAFNYDDIISWDGSPCEHGGVQFIINTQIRYMNASTKPPRVQYNPNDVGPMTPQARYFMIMHELSHVLHDHPGNDHPESVLNETQADDTALVNAMTYFPESASEYTGAIYAFFTSMIWGGELGGGTHPTTGVRRSRVQQLYEEIMDRATVYIEIRSNPIQSDWMWSYYRVNGDALLLQQEDIKTFTTPQGHNLRYIQGNGTVNLRRYLRWLPEFNRRQNDIPGFSYTKSWAIPPVAVQNQVKEDIAGGANYPTPASS